MLGIFESIEVASEAVSSIISGGVIPVALEMLDQEIIKIAEPRIHAGYPLDAGAVLLIEVEGLPDGVAVESEGVVEACRASGAREVRSAETQAERDKLWEGRKVGIGAIGAAAPQRTVHQLAVQDVIADGMKRIAAAEPFGQVRQTIRCVRSHAANCAHALPRWLSAFLSASDSSAKVCDHPLGTKSGS